MSELAGKLEASMARLADKAKEERTDEIRTAPIDAKTRTF